MYECVCMYCACVCALIGMENVKYLIIRKYSSYILLSVINSVD